jgi:hypothetical protein
MCLTPPHFYTIEICAYVLMMQPQLQFLRCDNFGSIVLKAINLSFPPSRSLNPLSYLAGIFGCLLLPPHIKGDSVPMYSDQLQSLCFYV